MRQKEIAQQNKANQINVQVHRLAKFVKWSFTIIKISQHTINRSVPAEIASNHFFANFWHNTMCQRQTMLKQIRNDERKIRNIIRSSIEQKNVQIILVSNLTVRFIWNWIYQHPTFPFEIMHVNNNWLDATMISIFWVDGNARVAYFPFSKNEHFLNNIFIRLQLSAQKWMLNDA